jgi:hypothetical protein
MKLKVEETGKQKILLLYKSPSPLLSELEIILTKYTFEIFRSTKLPPRLEQFDHIFIFASAVSSKLLQIPKIPTTLIVSNTALYQKALHTYKDTQIKIINIDTKNTDPQTIENMIWFILSKSGERGLNLEKSIKKIEKKPPSLSHPKWKPKKRHIFSLILFLLLFIETFFIFPLSFSFLYLYKTTQSLKQGEITKAQQNLYTGQLFLSVASTTYSIARPVLSFFYLALLPDNLFAMNRDAFSLTAIGLETTENGKKLVSLILKKDKSESEIAETQYRLDNLTKQVKTVSNKVSVILPKLDFDIPIIKKTHTTLEELNSSLTQLSKLLQQAHVFLGSDGEKKYLLLFQNNMELRPGGGFIGSYGIATFDHYSLKKLEIQDVYEADGQLKGHIDPPDAIRKYLQQPNWFLRDSNFSPDFPTNYNQAVFFLSKEMNISGLDGGIAITTTAINTLLSSFGDIYLPDFDETITKDNFYIKTQTHVENNFFAGSIQKRSFLSSLTQQLLLRLDDASPQTLFSSFKKSLNEKQIVVFMNNKDIQKSIDSLGWSGKLITPLCALNIDACSLDMFFPVDANLGVNKTNFFLERLLNLKVKITSDGLVKNTATLLYRNNSSEGVFPGGTYKNYLQIYLPLGSKIKHITKNGTLVEQYDTEDEGLFTKVSFYLEVLPKASDSIEIAYELRDPIPKGHGAYQLVVQKQIGTPNTDIHLEISLPGNISLINNNFSAVEKDGKVVYNTTLSSDKIFLIEFTKK